MVLQLREVWEAEEVGPEGECGGEGPVARRGVLGLLPGGDAMTGNRGWNRGATTAEVWCPWCHEWVSVRRTLTTFAAHVSRCPDAPESVKAAYRVPLYPPAGRR